MTGAGITQVPTMESLAYHLNGKLRVGWVCDDPGYIGGAELTAQQLELDAPDDVRVVHLPPPSVLGPGGAWDNVDVFVVHNCVHYPPTIIEAMARRPVVKYVHDAWPHGNRELRTWLLEHAYLFFASPLAVTSFPYPPMRTDAAPVICPPAMDVTPFREAAARREGMDRLPRALMLANHSKGIDAARAWAAEVGVELDVYGLHTENGPLDPAKVPDVMAMYEHFVHLPDVPEPFGRTVVEAFAAGCRVQVNANVGALWWVQNRPDLLEPGAASAFFWKGVRTAAGVQA